MAIQPQPVAWEAVLAATNITTATASSTSQTRSFRLPLSARFIRATAANRADISSRYLAMA